MKITKLVTVMMISVVLTACGSKEAASLVTEAEIIPETVRMSSIEKAEIPAVEIMSGAEPTEVEKDVEADRETVRETESVYEDNFAVDTSVAAKFADEIKAAVAAKDIEALADLTTFPVYVGIADGGVETREAFIALGAEKVFTPGLMESVGGADTSNLTPSMAGFSISKDGKSNIIFGVVEGRLAISGINYE